MCIICISPSGTRQPSQALIRTMFARNPDGAGFMVARNQRVEIHKGFMNCPDFIKTIRAQRFTAADAVVYHFRISTQGGIRPELTHPYPLTDSLDACTTLDLLCDVGVAHNGVIPLTSNPFDKHYNDTTRFIARYLSRLIRTPDDAHDAATLEMLSLLTGASRWALLTPDGRVSTAGRFQTYNGLLFSNGSYIGG